MSGKTLVAYASKSGVTEEYAYAIADVLKKKHKLDVDVVNLKKEKNTDISKYENIVLGGAVRIKRVYKEVQKFLGRDLKGKKIAIYLSSCEAGDPKTYPDAIRKYVEPIKEKGKANNIIAADAFGGRMKMFGKVVVDMRDSKKVEKWADDLGKKFKK
jgi:menaquinone-dependent protoporphyrinogen IX oxidase